MIDGGPIGSDHKKLARLANELYSAITKGRGFEVIGNITTELIGCTCGPLAREEDLMNSLHFTDLQKKYRQGRMTGASQLSTVHGCANNLAQDNISVTLPGEFSRPQVEEFEVAIRGQRPRVQKLTNSQHCFLQHGSKNLCTEKKEANSA